MDEESARKAREKADAIRKKVGFPLSPDTRDPRSLVSYYTLVKIHIDTFFENMLSAASVVFLASNQVLIFARFQCF